MDRNDFLAAVNRPGAFQRIEWMSEVKTAAAHKHLVVRSFSSGTGRTGVDYANLGVNADRETGSLPWGEWTLFPYLITHKGRDYARLYMVDGSIRTRYTVDGVETDRETVMQYLTPSARNKERPVGGTITVKLENVTLL